MERNADDGRLQLGLWSAADFAKIESLWLATCSAQDTFVKMPPLAPISLWLRKEGILHLRIAVMDSKDETFHILEVRKYDTDIDTR